MLNDTFQGSIFENPYGSPEGDGPHEPLASYGHNLEHAHSLPTALHFGTAPQSHQVSRRINLAGLPACHVKFRHRGKARKVEEKRIMGVVKDKGKAKRNAFVLLKD